MKTLKFMAVLLVLTAPFFLEAEEEAFKSWNKRKETLARDASVARHYTFEGVEDSKSTVRDMKGSGADLTFFPFVDRETREAVDDLEVIEGRYPGKPAVRLDRGWYQGAPFDIENGQFTAELWFRRNGPGKQKHALASNPERAAGAIMATANGSQKGWRLVNVYNQRQSLEFFMGSEPAGKARVYSYISVPDGIWHHLAATWDGEEMKIYLNGILAGSTMFNGRYVPSGKNDFFKVGYIRSGLGSVITDVDEIVIYNRVLSEEEISAAGRQQTASVEKILESADGYMKKGDFKNGRAEYEKLKGVTGINYATPMALFNIAGSYRMEKDYKSARDTYREIFKLPGLSPYYRIYGLFREAETYLEEKDFNGARNTYAQILNSEGALEHHAFVARMKTGDTYRAERKYSAAREIYKSLLVKEESSSHPHDVHRLELRDRLEETEGLTDGDPGKKRLSAKLAERITAPQKELYVSLGGNDENPGTKESPFATIERAQREVRRLKETGMHEGGTAVYLRGGNYFLEKNISFEEADSGSEVSPVVYRAYPGEKVRLIGGRQVKNFRILNDPGILGRLPEEARGKVWTADLKEAGITDYGKLLNRGGHSPHEIARPGAAEVIFNGKIMQLARWPNKGYEKIAGLPEPKGDGLFRNEPYQENRFTYSGNRPERWTGEKDAWVTGFLTKTTPFMRIHVKISSIDTAGRIITTFPDTRWPEKYIAYNTLFQKGGPYYVYNLLSELDSPGEWYIDRDAGRLYIWPPEDIGKSEVVVTTFDKPVVTFNKASHIALFGFTIEGTWTHGIEINGGRDILAAGCIIRNTGQYAAAINKGWRHAIVGCDIYDTGEGGVILEGGDQEKLVPSGHVVENCHIYRFNRFCGGYRPAVLFLGIGHRVSRNLIHDAPMHAMYIRGASAAGSSSNDHVIEFNEFHDVPHEAREFGAIYINSGAWRLQNRGNVIRKNFFHHISYHSSPNTSHGLNAIHIDSLNGGFAVTENFFYLVPNAISNPQPDNRLENNIFIEPEFRAIGQGNRAHILNDMDTGLPSRSALRSYSIGLNKVRYKQPPWSYRYPQLVDSLSGKVMLGWAKDNVIERNINTGSPFIGIAPGIARDNVIRNNWEEGDPFFVNREAMDFGIRTGSPVFGTTGSMPVSMEGIGVYEDWLRASWPVNRKKEDIGKYYMAGWKEIDQIASRIKQEKRISKALEYVVRRRSAPIMIDGKPLPEEWHGLDKNKAMAIEQHHKGEAVEAPVSHAWMVYDDRYLYVAAIHEADPYMEKMPARLKNHVPVLELSIEAQQGVKSRGWWMEDMPTGPIYSMTLSFNGELKVNNLFNMPHEDIKKLQDAVESEVFVADKEKRIWTSEMKIPLAAIDINPAEVEKLAFNLGTWKKAGWFAWVATGSKIWRIENAGLIKFLKE